MSHDLTLLPDDPRWKRFEKLVARIYATLAPNAGVTYNDNIQGRKSKITRQIDVSIRVSIAGSEILMIVQCRDYNHPADVNDVGEFAAVIDDIGASKGVMVAATHGFTEAAKSLAHENKIDLLTLVDAENKIWAEYFGSEPVRLEQDVSWPAIISRSSLSVSFTITTNDVDSTFKMPQNFFCTRLIDPDTRGIVGTPMDLISLLWEQEQIKDIEGVHFYIVELESPQLLVLPSGLTQIKRFRLSARVSRTHYYGKIPIERLQGLYNYADGSVTTKELATGPINMEDVIQNWEVVPPEGLSTKSVGFEFHVADAWPYDEAVRKLRVCEVREVAERELRSIC